jgi:hypothetical protein
VPPHRPRDLEPVDPRQHHVQHDRVKAVAVEQFQGALTRPGDLRLVALGLEVESEAIGKVLFVFDYQDLHVNR